jgi:hypothetical protein
MLLINIRTFWPHVIEYIHFDLAAPPTAGEFIFTDEFWKAEKRLVKYKVSVDHFDLEGDEIKFALTYQLSDNQHLDNQDVVWGTASYEINLQTQRAETRWQDVGTEVWVGGTRSSVYVSGYHRETQRELTERIKRNAVFRKTILQLDGCCAVTGESMPEALDAAHVLGVREKGRDTIDNGILLRSDLHRLFDMNYFTFNENGNVCDVASERLHESSGLTDTYRQALSGKSLPAEVLARILPNLRQRNSWPRS